MITLLTADEVAVRLKVSREHVYKLGKSGELRTVKLSRKVVRFFAEDLERYLKENTRAN